MPRFSFVIPTRDRPDLIKKTIQSMLAQTIDDFEIIVCDNFQKQSCEQEVLSFDDSRIKYHKNEEPLSLNDNWEKALSLSTGEFAGIFLDKVLIQPHCLERCLDLIKKNENLDIISWPRESYYPQTDDLFGAGVYTPLYPPQKPYMFAPREEWERRLSFETLRDGPGDYFHRGKIVFGFYSRRLLEDIYSHTDQLFPPFFPDYSSLSYGLAFGREAVDLMEPVVLGIQPVLSTGISLDTEVGFLERFLSGFEEAESIYGELPYENIFESQHNIAARDYLLAGKINGIQPPPLNKKNLAQCILYDLGKAPFKTEESRKKAIQSVIEQCEDVELVVAEDALLDSSLQIQNKYLDKLFKYAGNYLKLWPSLNSFNNGYDRVELALRAQQRFYRYSFVSRIYKFFQKQYVNKKT